jgi:hypothetical protein
LGLARLLVAAVGLGRVAWAWRSASRAGQLLCVAIVLNIGVYLVSVMPQVRFLGPHEIVAVLPYGAVLAVRACVPARITGVPQAFLAVTATALAALLPRVGPIQCVPEYLWMRSSASGRSGRELRR